MGTSLVAFSLGLSVDKVVWVIAASICLAGAVGVVGLRNPVHNALSLTATLFGVAVIFIVEKAYFLAAVQVIVYAGAIVVLFLFVIMLLGVDQIDVPDSQRSLWQRPVAAGLSAGFAVLVIAAALVGTAEVTGTRSQQGALRTDDVRQLGRELFTDHVFAFELTAVLLTVAVVGAVVMVRRVTGPPIDLDEFPRPDAEDALDLVPALPWDPSDIGVSPEEEP